MIPRGTVGLGTAGSALAILIALVLAGVVLFNYAYGPGARLITTTASQSDTTVSVANTNLQPSTTTTSPCGSPGVYCGPGFAVSNASLTSGSTLDENFSILSFNVNGTYSGLRIATLSIWLANASFSRYSFPDGSNGAHLVGTVSPTWSGKGGGYYTFDVPMAGFNAMKGAQCELWIDAYSVAPSPLRGDNWAEQSLTVG